MFAAYAANGRGSVLALGVSTRIPSGNGNRPFLIHNFQSWPTSALGTPRMWLESSSSMTSASIATFAAKLRGTTSAATIHTAGHTYSNSLLHRRSWLRSSSRLRGVHTKQSETTAISAIGCRLQRHHSVHQFINHFPMTATPNPALQRTSPGRHVGCLGSRRAIPPPSLSLFR